MRIISTFLVILGTFIFFACDDDEVSERDYPRLKTLEVTDLSEHGATFNAEIRYRGDFEVLNFGFVWSESNDPKIETADKVVFSENIRTSAFSATILSTLREQTTYFVRPFLITQSYTVYGKEVAFVSRGSQAPVITGILPTTGNVGDTIAIKGEHFSYRLHSNIVQFDNTQGTVVFASDSLLRVIVPETLPVGSVSVSVSVEIAEQKSEADQPFVLRKPMLMGIDKTTINRCDTVVLYVANLGPTSTPGIFFNDKSSTIVGRTTDQIKVLVPSLSSGYLKVSVRMHVGSFVSILPEVINLNFPDFTQLAPAHSAFLDTLTLSFRNMPHCRFDVKIDEKAVPLLESASDHLKVVVPATLDDPWKIRVQVYLDNENVFDTLYYRVLMIESVTPTSGSPGDIITIKGRGFHPNLNENVVCFTCQGTGFGAHGEIISGTTRELKVRIPVTPPNSTGISIFTQNLGTLNFPFEVR